MKYTEIKTRPHLLAPVLAATASSLPITCYDSLVYGYLVFRSKKGKSSTPTGIARSLKFDRVSCNRSLERLASLGLVSESGGRCQALEPTGTAQKLFMYRKDAEGDWQGRFVYDRVWLPEKPSDLPVRANLLFWRLYRVGRSVKGLPGHLVVGGNPKKIPAYLTNEYLSRAIQCDPKTIRSSLKRLRDLGLITVCKRVQGFVIGIRPLGDNVKLWRQSWNRRKQFTPVTVEELFLVPSKSEVVEETAARSGVLNRFRAYGISGHMAETLAALVLDEEVSPADWNQILQQCSADHNRNKEEGKTKHPHCGYLFQYMLGQYLRNRELRRAAAAPHIPKSLADIQVDDCMKAYRATEDAETLLRRAIRSESLKMDDGRVIPCPIQAEQVVAIAKQHKEDWDGFKTAIAKSVFTGDLTAVRCDWLREWLNAKQIPTEDDSPLAKYSVPRSDWSSIRSRIKDWVWESGCNSSTEAIDRTNGILKLACWQSACFKDPKTNKRVMSAVELVIDGLTPEPDRPDDISKEDLRSWTAPVKTARLGRETLAFALQRCPQ